MRVRIDNLKMYYSAVCVLIYFLEVFGDELVIVELQNGKVQGIIEQNIEQSDYYAFKGIPYAKPPVGSLRFQDPVSVKPWSGVRNATQYSLPCSQSNLFTKITEGNEDCLYLNVYTKSLDQNVRKPVMFWVYGGGFFTGDGSDSNYGPDYLLSKDIVLVTFNYRLGVFGFLSLEDGIITGNQGLKDQVMALEWVRDNIVKFGGDPSQVTLFGESTGGWSVHYLALSPLAEGLFTRVISQSGTVLTPGNYEVQTSRQDAFQISALLGNNTQDLKSIAEFLRSVDEAKLLKAFDEMTKETSKRHMFPFRPVVDANAKKPFMPVDFEAAVSKGIHVPLMIGYTNREAISFLPILKNSMSEFNDDLENHLHPRIPEVLKKYSLTIDLLKRLYLENEKLSEVNLDKMIDMMSDLYVVLPVHRVVEIQIQMTSSPTYLYQFSYDNNNSPTKKLLNITMPGAAHADDLNYLFRAKIFEQWGVTKLHVKGSSDYKIMEQMIDLWVNFASTGKPTNDSGIDWQPVNNATHLRYLNIDEDTSMNVTFNLNQQYAIHCIHNEEL